MRYKLFELRLLLPHNKSIAFLLLGLVERDKNKHFSTQREKAAAVNVLSTTLIVLDSEQKKLILLNHQTSLKILHHQQCYPNHTLPTSAAANEEFSNLYDGLAKSIFLLITQ